MGYGVSVTEIRISGVGISRLTMHIAHACMDRDVATSASELPDLVDLSPNYGGRHATFVRRLMVVCDFVETVININKTGRSGGQAPPWGWRSSGLVWRWLATVTIT